MAIADAVYGLAGALVVYTGYLRVTAYGKGWEFYQHEPIFWFKMALLAVMGGKFGGMHGEHGGAAACNLCGGIEFGFTSTSKHREEALSYATGQLYGRYTAPEHSILPLQQQGPAHAHGLQPADGRLSQWPDSQGTGTS